jgi:enamine deaminase RidA (YjgF/YER057c/UK114 family)
MRILNFLSGIAPVLVCLAAPTEGSGGSSSETPATPASEFPLGADAQAPEVVGATIEDQRTNALSALGKLFKQAQGLFSKVTSLTSDLASAKSDTARIQGLYDALLPEATQAKAEVTRLTSELSAATTSLATEKQHVKNLESHCGVLGIDAKEAIKAPKQSADGGQGGTSNANDEAIYKQWKGLTGTAKTKFRKANEAALDRYATSKS